MGYRIEYDRGSGKYEVRDAHPWRFPILLLVSVAVLSLLAMQLWPEGAAELRSMLIPGDDDVTVQAIQNMTWDLRSGAGLSDALEAFCRFVIHGK